MLKNLFVISDIHGQISQMRELLECWDPINEILVIAGDMVDRGENPFGVVNYLYELKKEYPEHVIVLKGNHEELFLRWLDAPETFSHHYLRCGGLQTVDSFLQMVKNTSDLSNEISMSKAIQEELPEMIHFLRNLPFYYEHGQYVVVHAGVRLAEEVDWRDSQEKAMLWIREDFYSETVKNNTDKIFIFGHTPTHDINKGESTNIWISGCQTKIGIDGGAVYGGTLNGLKLDVNTGDYQSIQIKHPFLEEYIEEN